MAWRAPYCVRAALGAPGFARCHFHHISLHKNLSQLPGRIKTSFRGNMAPTFPNLSLFSAFFSGLVFLLSLNTLQMFSSPGISSPPPSTVTPNSAYPSRIMCEKHKLRKAWSLLWATGTSSSFQCLKLIFPFLTWLPHFLHLCPAFSMRMCQGQDRFTLLFPSLPHPLTQGYVCRKHPVIIEWIDECRSRLWILDYDWSWWECVLRDPLYLMSKG